jgi:hypothetical protein
MGYVSGIGIKKPVAVKLSYPVRRYIDEII